MKLILCPSQTGALLNATGVGKGLIVAFVVADAVHELAETIKVLDKIKAELSAREVLADPDSAKVSLIGAGLCGQPWIPARLFSTLGKNGINIKMISSSEMKITCVVSRAQAQKAAKLIHDAFELENSAKAASRETQG